MQPSSEAGSPLVSVIVLNYNGNNTLERCLHSLQRQTIFQRLEIIVVDNVSTDGSNLMANKIVSALPGGRFIQNSENLGFCKGNNCGAKNASGKYLLFLNNDTWLEPDCLEILVRESESWGASAATPLVMNFNDDTFQSLGAPGFDIFGLASSRIYQKGVREVLMPEGCSYLVLRSAFEQLGGLDDEFFMYSDELDLSWRLWIAGYKAAGVPSARLHHRGAANVNPRGGNSIVEFRTSDTKRFYANRNALLVLLKNAQHFLLILVFLQLGLLALEILASLVLVRRLSFIRYSYFGAIADCWRLRRHILAERGKIRRFRRRGDWQMLRFFRFRLNRWDEIRRALRFGPPKVTADSPVAIPPPIPPC